MNCKTFLFLMMASSCIFASCSNDDIDNTDTKSSTTETGSYRASNKVSDITHCISAKMKQGDVLLSYNTPVYFYDPIVDSEETVNGKKTYKYHEYNSGTVTFGIDVR